ncbi:MAG: deoxyribonuclease IV [Acidimicrobiales bacterium]
MRIGAHVRAGNGYLGALDRAHEIGAEVIQVFTQSPRAWRPSQYSPDVLERYRAAAAGDPVVTATFCHATYLINLATDDPALLERSRACLAANLEVATGMGASGLVLHVGSHKGAGFDGCVRQVVDTLLSVLTGAGGAAPGAGDGGNTACPILLENAAGAGGTVGRSFEELAAILTLADAGDALGVCLDTQHLWASGVAYGGREAASAALDELARTVGRSALRCVHVNDSKVELGANRDRHANIGEGMIGTEALGWLMAHPALDGLPGILEVPGSGDGPRAEDVEAARRALAQGRAQWKGVPADPDLRAL